MLMHKQSTLFCLKTEPVKLENTSGNIKIRKLVVGFGGFFQYGFFQPKILSKIALLVKSYK